MWQAVGNFGLQIIAAWTLGAAGLGLISLSLGVIILATALASGMVGDSLVILRREDPRVRGPCRVGPSSSGWPARSWPGWRWPRPCCHRCRRCCSRVRSWHSSSRNCSAGCSWASCSSGGSSWSTRSLSSERSAACCWWRRSAR
ncbi:hypothetical protein G7085_05215 [Tessaracoccus sp. HDW20]|uniref:hypothetical protein n=1 Tax=Tessaracoccus coleopterorum TaxID=2714950 RepID=UPI0018D47C3C|nr:hypothetical protein [Tessaracoccus coleopterorum]NHB84230.1 hypothetical protein [Tessaracoccus coleopterorum]